MPRIILDIQCNKCEYVKEIWATPEERDKISNAESLCEACQQPISIVVGKPQFQLKRGCGGFESPGKY